MAEFLPAFERMLMNEGGYRLTKVSGDNGGWTYAGISRRSWPDWPGWDDIDSGRVPDATMVRGFYRANFWMPLSLDDVANQRIAQTLFDFAVNAGTATAAKLAQLVLGTTPDGKVGPKTVAAMNAANPDMFVPMYALAKIARYRDIVTRDRSQSKFLLGWINRTLKEAA